MNIKIDVYIHDERKKESNDETMRRIQRGEGLENIPQSEKSKGICHERRI